MSGKYEDILASIESHFPPEKWEQVKRIVSILSRHHPKVDIDRVHQSELRDELLTSQKSVIKIQIPWLRISSGIGLVCTCFIAVFGFWKILSPVIVSWPELWDSKQIWAVPSASEWKIVTNLSQEIPSQGVATNTPITTSIAKKQVDTFLAEKWSIDTEIASIGQDMLDIVDITEKPSSQKQEVAQVTKKIVSESPWSQDTNIDPSMLSTSAIATMTSRLTLPSQTIEAPVYPSVMKIYKKSGAWTESEILARSGSGSVVEQVTTEKLSIIASRVATLIGDRSIVSSEIVYRVRTRMARDPDGYSYLIPVIVYRTDASDEIVVPLVRGYR